MQRFSCSVLLVLLLVALGLPLAGCSSSEPEADTRELLEAVNGAQRLLSQAQALMSLTVVEHTPSGDYSPFASSRWEEVFSRPYRLGQAAQAPPGSEEEPDAQDVEAYNEALEGMPIRTLPYGDVHPHLLSESPAENVLLQAQNQLGDALGSADQADDETKLLARITLVQIQEARARALRLHAGALRQAGMLTAQEIRSNLDTIDNLLARADQYQTQAQALSQQGELPGLKERIASDLNQLTQEKQGLVSRARSAADKAKAQTDRYNQKNLEYSRKLAQAKEAEGEQGLELLRQAVAISQEVTDAATQARQAQAEANKANNRLTVIEAQIESLEKRLDRVQSGMDDSEKSAREYRQMREDLLAKMKGPEGIQTETAELIKQFAATVSEIYQFEVEAENILTTARDTYQAPLSRSREPQALSALGELAFGQSNLIRAQLSLDNFLGELESTIQSQWSQLEAPAPEGLAKLQSYVSDRDKMKASAAELAGKAGEYFAQAASFVSPRQGGKWVYQQNAAIAYAGQYLLSRDSQAQSNADEALKAAIEGRESNPRAAENNRQIREILEQ